MSIEFKPRPYQTLIIDHMLQTERNGCWAAMGTGKSVSTLTALDTLQLLDSREINEALDAFRWLTRIQ